MQCRNLPLARLAPRGTDHRHLCTFVVSDEILCRVHRRAQGRNNRIDTHTKPTSAHKELQRFFVRFFIFALPRAPRRRRLTMASPSDADVDCVPDTGEQERTRARSSPPVDAASSDFSSASDDGAACTVTEQKVSTLRRRTMRKLGLRICPSVFLATFSLQLDKTNMAFARDGLAEAASLDDAQYGLAASGEF